MRGCESAIRVLTFEFKFNTTPHQPYYQNVWKQLHSYGLDNYLTVAMIMDRLLFELISRANNSVMYALQLVVNPQR